MPAFVIIRASGRIGETIDGIMCDPNPATGYPDRHTDTPVKIKRISENVLAIDGEPLPIISTTGLNGTVTYLLNGTSKRLRNRDKRIALARAAALLQQVASVIKPLIAVSEEPDYAIESLQTLFDWIREERERLTVAPRLDADGGSHAA